MICLRLAVANFAGICFAICAWWIGYLQLAIHADSSHIGALILALFLAGVASAFWTGYAADRALPDDIARIKIKSAHLETIVIALFAMGLVGNAQGLLMGFHNIDVDALRTAEGAQRFAVQVLSGIGSTFGSTVIGVSLGLWTMMNVQIVKTRLDLMELD